MDNFENVDKYETLQRRGRFYLENYNYVKDGLQKAYADFESMFELDPEKTTSLADGYYIRVMVDNMSRNDARKDEVIKVIDAATPYATTAILTFFDEILDGLFNTPEERITYCSENLEENPNSLADLQCLADAYQSLNMQSELVEILKKIHQLNPTFESALKLADVEQGNAKYGEAEKLYTEALEKAPTDKDKKEINIDLADVNISMENLELAKKYILKALDIDKSYGLAYIKMATIYSQAITSCTEQRDLEPFDRVVYWVVIDYLNKAKSVDQSVKNTVDSQLPSYEAVQPSTQDKFFDLSYTDGQKVSVNASLNECYSWINETTTVR